jgi:hypothetical protein
MTSVDILSVFFKNALQMPQYPKEPFTGGALYDIGIFFILPTVFIILVIYWLLSAVVRPGNIVERAPVRLLIGFAVYAYAVASGFYAIFALIGGTYPFLLIVGLGVSYYFIPHLGIGRPAATLKEEHNRTTNGSEEQKGILEIMKEIRIVNNDIRMANERLTFAHAKGYDREAAELVKRLDELEDKRTELEKRLPLKRVI